MQTLKVDQKEVYKRYTGEDLKRIAEYRERSIDQHRQRLRMHYQVQRENYHEQLESLKKDRL